VLDEKHFLFRGASVAERVPGEDRRLEVDEEVVTWWE
jgi:hypothetical protein